MIDATTLDQAERMADQYSIWQILGLWLAGGAPMWVLGWVVFPAASAGLGPVDAGLLRLELLTAGLIWQFVLSMTILYREEGNIRLETIGRRFWLNKPISPKTGQPDGRLWWLLIPLIVVVAVLQMFVFPAIDGLWTQALPFLAEPEGYSSAAMFAPDMLPQWVGMWSLLIVMIVLSVFNTFLGEEFLFRGVLLPKMRGVFGRWDWLANGVIFGLYHLHQPWGLPGNIIDGTVFAFLGKQYRCNWFPIVLHSGQSIYFMFLVLGVVLGVAR